MDFLGHVISDFTAVSQSENIYARNGTVCFAQIGDLEQKI